jgi:transcriptional regulator with XRE-family HTH domain
MERDFQVDWAELVEEAHRRRKAQGISMRRLAALANVSLPTVLRFEKNERDIQVSSVLAILGALGMLARKIEGTLLVRGAPDGPYQAMFAPSAGAGGALESRNVPAQADLEAFLVELGIDADRRRLAFANLVRDGAASITGVRLSPRMAGGLWPKQLAAQEKG